MENTEPTISTSAKHEEHSTHTVHHHTKRSEGKLTTPAAILLGAAMIAVGIVAYGFIMQGGQAKSPKTMFVGKTIDPATDYIEGKAKSDVVLVEYSDPECPFCVQAHPIIKQIRDEYKGKIAFVYRHFPLTQIHSHAFDEARAISCAGIVGGQEKYYEYIDAFFGYKESHKTTQLTATGKEDIAKTVGLDVNAFLSCMKDTQAGEKVQASLEDGVQAGVQGTPASFVLVKTRKGYEVISMIDGARPYPFFKAAIEEALAR